MLNTEERIQRQEGVLIIMQEQIKDIIKIQREQTKSLNLINQNLTQLNTTLAGIPGTDEKGICGKVNRQDIRIARLERLFWAVLGILMATNIINVTGIWH